MINGSAPSLRVLLLEDDAGYARLVGILLEQGDPGNLLQGVDVSAVDRLSAARTRLAQGGVGLVLLDLTLPDSQGLDTLTGLIAEWPEVPIIVLTSIADEALALRALQLGAQDYLIKSEVDRRSLFKSMRYSIERHRLHEQLRSLSLTDPLTGLYNRRGFMTVGERQLKVATRRVHGAIVLLVDLDQLKTINDRFGHAEGDRALQHVAVALRGSLRDEDIVGRLGGDEFAVAALDVSAAAIEPVLVRLEAHLARVNARDDQPYLLRVSTGWARLDPDKSTTLEAVMCEADAQLYRAKERRRFGSILKSPGDAAAALPTAITQTPS
jgi:diguanylate cyclase (GGDEF)-like protein